MAKLSVREASRCFDVSRPTLVKHLKSGKLSGEPIGGGGWLIDPAEMVRAGYAARPEAVSDGKGVPGKLTTIAPFAPVNDGGEIAARLAIVEAALEAEREKTALLERHLDDVRRMLPPPNTKPRRWWMW